MPSYPFMQVDAFTNQPLGGNPCAVVFDADDLASDTMQAIAREMNLSETAFVLRSDLADVRARYFTPAEEIPLAGHPTIATVYALAETQRIRLTGDRTPISLELQVGPIPVDVLAHQGMPYRIVMTQKKPVFSASLDADLVLPAFGLSKDDILPNVPIQVVSTGTPQLMVAVRRKQILQRIAVDTPLLTQLRETAGFFSAHLFCLDGITAEGDTFARHFASPPDVFEDPFTGSATGGMGAFLWRHGLISRASFVAEQGHWMQRPGQAMVEVIGAPNDIEAVKVGGAAVTVMRGTLDL